jgi:hypothetical protein
VVPAPPSVAPSSSASLDGFECVFDVVMSEEYRRCRDPNLPCPPGVVDGDI